MKIIHFLLLPLSALYSLMIRIWLWTHKRGYSGQVSFSVPIISVGNIQVGGTGKTPMVDFICEKLGRDFYLAVLSRGYKRLSYGFRMVHELDTYKNVGDEPLWLKNRHPHVAVGVAENRVEGVPYLMSHALHTQAIILDDGFQQLGMKIGLNILLTPYHQPFTQDWMLPAGRRREPVASYQRADVIVITKCPEEKLTQKKTVLSELNISPFSHQKVFLSSICYTSPYLMFYEGNVISYSSKDQILLVTGIADAEPLKKYIESQVKFVQHIAYSDHYRFKESDLEQIIEEYNRLSKHGKTIIITTEKDAMRLRPFRGYLLERKIEIFVQPMSIVLDDEKGFWDAFYNLLPRLPEQDGEINHD